MFGDDILKAFGIPDSGPGLTGTPALDTVSVPQSTSMPAGPSPAGVMPQSPAAPTPVQPAVAPGAPNLAAPTTPPIASATGAAAGALLPNGMRGLADGGDAAAGEPIVVGERGPEVVVPQTPVRVQSHEDVWAQAIAQAIMRQAGGPTYAEREPSGTMPHVVDIPRAVAAAPGAVARAVAPNLTSLATGEQLEQPPEIDPNAPPGKVPSRITDSPEHRRAREATSEALSLPLMLAPVAGVESGLVRGAAKLGPLAEETAAMAAGRAPYVASAAPETAAVAAGREAPKRGASSVLAPGAALTAYATGIPGAQAADDPADVKKLQQKLYDTVNPDTGVRFYSGAIDGVKGESTKAAERNYMNYLDRKQARETAAATTAATTAQTEATKAKTEKELREEEDLRVGRQLFVDTEKAIGSMHQGFRNFAPMAGYVTGGLMGMGGRYLVLKGSNLASRLKAEGAEKIFDRSLEEAAAKITGKKLPKLSTPDRVALVNEFFRKGGAGPNVPFKLTPGESPGFAPNPNVADVSSLYAAPSKQQTGTDLGFILGGIAESGYFYFQTEKAREHMIQAEAEAKAHPNAITIQAYEDAIDFFKLNDAAQNWGRGLAGMYALSAAKVPRTPSVPSAVKPTSEQHKLGDILARSNDRKQSRIAKAERAALMGRQPEPMALPSPERQGREPLALPSPGKKKDQIEGSVTGAAFWEAVKAEDSKLTGDAARAVDNWVGGPHDSVQMGLKGGLMIPSRLESMPPAEWDRMAQPIRRELRAAFGDSIVVYRGSGGGNQSSGRQNKLTSYTTDPRVAETFAGVGKAAPLISEGEIVRAERQFLETGEVTAGGRTFRREDGGVQLYDREGQHITDTPSVRAELEHINAERSEVIAKNAAARQKVRSVRLPVDAVVWATDRFNQKEIIAKSGFEKAERRK